MSSPTCAVAGAVDSTAIIAATIAIRNLLAGHRPKRDRQRAVRPIGLPLRAWDESLRGSARCIACAHVHSTKLVPLDFEVDFGGSSHQPKRQQGKIGEIPSSALRVNMR